MITVEIDDARLSATVERLALTGLRESTLTEMTRTAQDLEGEISRQVVQRLTKRPRGGLARSWRTTIEVDRDDVRAVVASNLPYARIQDQGGTVYPVRARSLAIPVEGPGGPRPGQGPRLFGRPLEYRPARGGRGRLVEVRGTGARAREITRYILAPSVRIEGERYIDAAIAVIDPTGALADRVARDVRTAWEG
jgi:phage gpG-like protein